MYFTLAVSATTPATCAALTDRALIADPAVMPIPGPASTAWRSPDGRAALLHWGRPETGDLGTGLSADLSAELGADRGLDPRLGDLGDRDPAASHAGTIWTGTPTPGSGRAPVYARTSLTRVDPVYVAEVPGAVIVADRALWAAWTASRLDAHDPLHLCALLNPGFPLGTATPFTGVGALSHSTTLHLLHGVLTSIPTTAAATTGPAPGGRSRRERPSIQLSPPPASAPAATDAGPAGLGLALDNADREARADDNADSGTADRGVAGADIPGGTLPGGDIPGRGLPGGGVPGGGLPGGDISGPGLAEGDIPGGTLPGGDIPGPGLAEGDIPGGTLLGGGVPGGGWPGGGVPGRGLANGDIPGGTLLGGGVPGSGWPGGGILVGRGPGGARAVAEALVAAVAGLRKSGEPVELSLTGGKDSRLVAAALVAAGVPVVARTHGFADHPDVVVAAEIARRLGIEHIVRTPAAPGQRIEVLGRIRATVLVADGMLSAFENVGRPDPAASLAVTAGGHGGELLRGGYAETAAGRPGAVGGLRAALGPARRAARSAELLRRLTTRHLGLIRRGPAAGYVASLSPWGAALARGPLAALDDFYLVNRAGRWSAAARQAYLIRENLVQPLFDEQVVLAARAVPLADRVSGTLTAAVLAELCPALSDIRLAGQVPAAVPGPGADTANASFDWRRQYGATIASFLRGYTLDLGTTSGLFDVVSRPAAEKLLTPPHADRSAVWALATLACLLSGDYRHARDASPQLTVT